ncbi:phosphopyruvate hydratase [Candidatus Woesearchaeota archaeon]|nr:phosphopyruvate hydratase [Candidatus Woesearchaeota archaeon]
MSKITNVKARQILDSRGNPTVEVEVSTKSFCARASVPSGVSTGKYEAFELRDNSEAFRGLGVTKAVNNVNKIIAKKLIGKELPGQEELDNFLIKLDGTKNKSKLGANAILGVSMAVCKVASREKGRELYEHIGKLYGTKKFTLPIPAFNIIEGGKHAGNSLDFQEFMVWPVKCKSFSEALQVGSEIYQELKEVIKKKHGKSAINIGDEGGFAPPLTCYEEPFELILDAAKELGYENKIKLGIDAAATSFYRDRKYYLEGTEASVSDLLEKYVEMSNVYPLVSIEDPFHEEDFENFSKLVKKAKNCQIVGDDLLTTNVEKIQKAIVQSSCNCLLLKLNQIGTVTEAFNASKLVMQDNWNVMVSHRGGETNDDFIADLAVGISSEQIKAGAPCRGERLAKYNQLLRIEESLGKKAKFGK